MATKAEKAALAAQAAALKERAVAISGMTSEQYDALSEDERNAFLAQAVVAMEQDSVASASEGLITMVFNGDEIDVHPSCVADHERLGWRINQ